MNLTRRFGSGRGRLSLRSRLLAGLITVTALFLIIMGVVTTVVLGNSEQNQFNSDLSLTARIKLTEVADLTGGYAVVYINIPTRKVGVLSSPSASRSAPRISRPSSPCRKSLMRREMRLGRTVSAS